MDLNTLNSIQSTWINVKTTQVRGKVYPQSKIFFRAHDHSRDQSDESLSLARHSSMSFWYLHEVQKTEDWYKQFTDREEAESLASERLLRKKNHLFYHIKP